MSDRLTELQRQRALAQEQVAWFEREIARESGATPKSPDPVIPSAAAIGPAVGGAPSLSAVASAKAEPLSAAPPEADELLKQYQSSGTSIHSEVKRGCLLYFFAAFALLTVGVAAFYFFWKQ